VRCAHAAHPGGGRRLHPGAAPGGGGGTPAPVPGHSRSGPGSGAVRANLDDACFGDVGGRPGDLHGGGLPGARPRAARPCQRPGHAPGPGRVGGGRSAGSVSGRRPRRDARSHPPSHDRCSPGLGVARMGGAAAHGGGLSGGPHVPDDAALPCCHDSLAGPYLFLALVAWSVAVLGAPAWASGLAGAALGLGVGAFAWVWAPLPG
jgi:hypothetical protein